MLGNYKKLLSGMLALTMVFGQNFGVMAANEAERSDTDPKYVELKEDMQVHDVAGTMENLVEGEDYAEGKIWYLADTREEADDIAARYNATVVKYSYKVATAELNGDMTVLDAVRAASETDNDMPPVEALSYSSIEIDEVVEEEAEDGLDAVGGATVPTTLTWKDYLYGTDADGEDPILDDPDPFLTHPSEMIDQSLEYQYQHDVVNTWEAWGTSIGNPGVHVGVIDTGVFEGHEDFIDPFTGECYVKKAVGIADENVVVSGDHGTHVAGIIAAALNNGKGGAGIAPGVSIYSYDVSLANSENMTIDDVTRGIQACIDDGMDIINMSLGGHAYSANMKAVLKEAYEEGICVFACAHNFSSNSRIYPAAFAEDSSTGVISVGATNYEGKKAFFTNYGPWVSVCAPGTKIISTAPYTDPSTGLLDTSVKNYYVEMSGTSQATPVASGVAALYLSAYGTTLNGSKDLAGTKALPQKMKSIMLNNASKSVSGIGKLVNVGKMFAAEKKSPLIVAYDENNEVIPLLNNKKNVYYDVYKVEIRNKASVSANHIKTGSERYLSWNKETIYYTLDGTDPKVDPETLEVINGTKYTDDTNLWIENYKPGSKHTIKALAVTSNSTVTSVASATVYAPAADSSVTVSSVVKDIKLISQNTKDDSKIKGKKSVVTCGVDTLSRFDFITPELTFNNGTVQTAGDFSDELKSVMYWTSSNPNVAMVERMDEYGNCSIHSIKKGSCKVTLYVYSKGKVQKSKSIKVDVKQTVDEIGISGQSVIEPKTTKKVTAKYKASCLPSSANTKTVSWYLESSDGSVSDQSLALTGGTVSISSYGKVTVEPGVEKGQTFYVCAVSADTGIVTQKKEVTIGEKTTTGVQILVNEDELSDFQRNVYKKNKNITYTGKGLLKSVTLANVDLPESSVNDNAMTFYSRDNVPAVWTVSNKKILSLSANEAGTSAVVYGLKEGSAVLTCKAADGSNNVARVTVKVKIPVSGVGLGTNYLYQSKPLAVGKSRAIAAKVGSTFGKPSNSNLTWSYYAGYVLDNGNNTGFHYGECDDSLTAEVASAIKFDEKTGRVTVKKNKWNPSYNDKVYLYVTATATDGTGYCDSLRYIVVTPATGISVYHISDDNTLTLLDNNSTINMDSTKNYRTLYVVADGNGVNNAGMQVDAVSVKSSKPKCGGAAVVGYGRSLSLGKYMTVLGVYGGESKGTACINMVTNDGTGKKFSLYIKTESSSIK